MTGDLWSVIRIQDLANRKQEYYPLGCKVCVLYYEIHKTSLILPLNAVVSEFFEVTDVVGLRDSELEHVIPQAVNQLTAENISTFVELQPQLVT